MRITVTGFEPGKGVEYTIKAQNETERVLLYASVNQGVRSAIIEIGTEETEFKLFAKVFND